MPFPVAEERVRACEDALGVRLPEPLRSALKTDNGGEIATPHDLWRLHPVEDTSDRKRLSRTANHIVRETRAAHGYGLPADLVVLADNESGDHLVLRDGTVSIWRLETGLEPAPPLPDLMALRE